MLPGRLLDVGGCWTGEVRNDLQKLQVMDASSAGEPARDLMSKQQIKFIGQGCVIAWWTAIMPFSDFLMVWSPEPRLWSSLSC